MPIDPAISMDTALRVGLLLVLAAVGASVWYFAGRDRWWTALTDRFVLGVPWGSLITIVLVLGVYLFVQSGIEAWNDPAVFPFRSWSYAYPLGMLAAGFAHAGPGHLVGNLVGAAIFSPLVEYAWGHYPDRDDDQNGPSGTGHRYPPPAAGDDLAGAATRHTADSAHSSPAASDQSRTGILSHPVLRAVVFFPLAIIAISILTSVFARGWSLGYSGTVFFLIGVAVVRYPLASLVGVVVLSGVNVLIGAFQTPILEVGLGGGAPSPPSWAGVNVQAHLLGFLIGVIVALIIFRRRDSLPRVDHLSLAVIVVMLAIQLWSLTGGGGGRFVRYQAPGVIFVLLLAVIIIAAVAIENEAIVGPLSVRGVILGGIAIVVVLLALSSIPPNLPGMADDPVPAGGAIQIDDYTVTYAEDAEHGRVNTTSSGVIVVSEKRDIWSTAISDRQLRHNRDGTVTLGGVGWRETVDVERTGWYVAGNDSVYTVDLHHGETIRAFTSEPRRADTRLAGYNFTVVPTASAFRLDVSRGGETKGYVAIPDVNQTATVPLGEETDSEMTVHTRERDFFDEVVVEYEESRVVVAVGA